MGGERKGRLCGMSYDDDGNDAATCTHQHGTAFILVVATLRLAMGIDDNALRRILSAACNERSDHLAFLLLVAFLHTALTTLAALARFSAFVLAHAFHRRSRLTFCSFRVRLCFSSLSFRYPRIVSCSCFVVFCSARRFFWLVDSSTVSPLSNQPRLVTLASRRNRLFFAR